MNVLAVDTCFGALSVAAGGNRAGAHAVLAEADEARKVGGAERLMPMIREVMQAAGLMFPELDRLAVTVGPGTFTGVRTGIAAIRGLALATGKPVVTMTSLSVMAAHARGHLPRGDAGRALCVAVDARQGLAYVQVFDADGEAGLPALVSPEQAAGLIGRGKVFVAGSGAAAVAAAVAAAGGQAEAGLPDLRPQARVLAMAAPSLVPVDRVVPLYLRAPDVKPQPDGSTLWAKS
jgi:tRNA threonylcarbamoyladenosine biosynthesis protein TsaB